MRIKTINYLLISLMMSISVACSSDLADDTQPAEPTATVRATFRTALPALDEVSVASRATQDKKLHSLRLLVFDANQQFLYSRQPVLVQDLGGVGTEEIYPDPDSSIDPNQLYTFETELFASDEPRYIHFVANYDWTDFEPDYFLLGVDAGELIGSMQSTQTTYWRVLELNTLTQESLDGLIIQLLRNQARISVESTASGFELQSYAVYRAYNKGTVAPFVLDEQGRGRFPLTPEQPTTPPGVSLSDTDFGLEPLDVFERSNQGGSPLVVLIKGKYKKRDYYYKLDIKHVAEQTGISSLHDILRNRWYKIRIIDVTTIGYDTLQEALDHPAGNNIIASIEMEDFYKVSEAGAVLEVTPMGGVLVQTGQQVTFEVRTNFKIEEVNYFPSWDETDDYLKPLSVGVGANPRSATAQLKTIPTDRELLYTVTVVAKTTEGRYLTRKVKLIARSAYPFHGELTSTTNNSYNLSFTIPLTLSQRVFPFPVLIHAPGLTPDPSHNMTLVMQGGKLYYEYIVNDPTQVGKKIQLNGWRNNNAGESGKGTLTLHSIYFNSQSLAWR